MFTYSVFYELCQLMMEDHDLCEVKSVKYQVQ